MSEQLILPKTQNFNIILVPLSPGIDLEEYGSLICNHFHKKRSICKVLKDEDDTEQKPGEYHVWLCNQNLDSWSTQCIQQGDIVLYLTKQKSLDIDNDIKKNLNSIVGCPNQQRWHCIDIIDPFRPVQEIDNLEFDRSFPLVLKNFEPLLKALSTKDSRLILKGLSEDKLPQIALYAALNKLGFDIASVEATEANLTLAEMISSGLSPFKTLNSILSNQSVKPSFWSKNFSNRNALMGLDSSSSDNVTLETIESLASSIPSRQISSHARSAEIPWVSANVISPTSSNHDDYELLHAQMIELRTAFIHQIIALEKACSLTNG